MIQESSKVAMISRPLAHISSHQTPANRLRSNQRAQNRRTGYAPGGGSSGGGAADFGCSNGPSNRDGKGDGVSFARSNAESNRLMVCSGRHSGMPSCQAGVVGGIS